MGKVISSVNDVQFKAHQQTMVRGTKNGAYYYAQEIEQNIAPLLKTERPIDTLTFRGNGSADHAICFLHHNLDHDRVYEWLNRYEDQILVCSVPVTYEWAVNSGHKAIFLPLSVDVDYVKQFRRKKKFGACYAGNLWKFKVPDIEKYVKKGTDLCKQDIEREELLKFIAQYRQCYAVGRCAIEAKILGCEVLMCDSRYPDPSVWQVLDNKDAAKMLQAELDKIDKK